MKVGFKLILILATLLPLTANTALAQGPKSSRTVTKAPAKAAPASPAAGQNLDLAYGAYQRGFYLLAFAEATRRASEQKDPKAMTLLGELYAYGIGVPLNDKLAAEWYRLAAAAGDREAMLGLGTLYLQGRGVEVNRNEAARLFTDAAERGNPSAAYNLALLHLEGKVVTNDYNLNKVAKLHNVGVINLNDIANSLKPVFLPGESIDVRIVKVGEEPGQGVGYLEDGTMVVIEGGREHIGEQVAANVTSVLQTSAGRMVFGRYLSTIGKN